MHKLRPRTHTTPLLGQARAEMLGQEGDVLEVEVEEEEEEIDGLVPAHPVSASFELMEAMADRSRVVEGRHHSTLAAIAMGLKWHPRLHNLHAWDYGTLIIP